MTIEHATLSLEVSSQRRGQTLRLLASHRPLVLGATILLVLLIIAVAAPLLGTVDPAALSPARRNRAPSELYWFGTDQLGRDIYSRVIYGTRISLIVGLSVAVLSAVAGIIVGMIAGYIRWTDGIIMRMMDGLMSIPPILLAIALMTLTRGSLGNVIVAITISEIPRVARVVRGALLSLREQPFVLAAVATGVRVPRIMLRHILPNIMAPVIIQATYICGAAMLTEAILSFIGAGLPPTIPSWGNIMAEGRALWQVKPYMIAFPAIFLSIAILAVNLVGDGFRDALDPRLRER
ncbi:MULTISPECIES: ABC transporter permease [unclassified Chelatococcus]|uniref:ABC transporter permease n=1 Tax=unclassified Chelatococcus TaxID=2638111 RepID=UPI001BCE7E31|nr:MULTISPECIES: ABC transporter permease [unclassified Chelatococcus]MBS7700721.1 ABC transporter permease [Chelatococcus sp. YT9]MBX3559305.1 ABC transporter permease [Chelatococcus sp.]